MKDLFNQISNGLGGLGGLGDKLNGALGGQQKADAPSGQGTGNALGDMVKSAGGLGGLLGLGGARGTARHADVGQDGPQGCQRRADGWWDGRRRCLGMEILPEVVRSQRRGPTGATRRTGPVSPARTERLARRAAANAAPGCFGGSDGPVVAGGDGFRRRADGHIDDRERANIHNAVESLFPGRDMAQVLDMLLNKPLDPASLASRIANHDEARDLYRLSAMIIDVDHFMERSYLDGLAAALKIAPEEKAALDSEVEENKRTAIEPS